MTENSSELIPGLVIGRKRDGRCIYSKEGKQALVIASVRRGASVARIAQQHGVNANLLRKWIDAYHGRGKHLGVSAAATRPKLLPVIEIGSPTKLKPSLEARAGSFDGAYIELELCAVKVRVYGEVSARQLELVLSAVVRRT